MYAIAENNASAAIAATTLNYQATHVIMDVNWYLVNETPALGGTASVTFRWFDGTANRSFTSTALSLLGTSFVSGQLTIYSADGYYPTYETTVVSVLGTPDYTLRFQYDPITCN